jgi:proteasome lid subunit RPN8/RPN11
MRLTSMKPMTLRHPDPWGPEVILAAQQHAMEQYPKESCGLVTGDKYVPCENMHMEPEKAFKIDPGATAPLIAAGTLQAVIHSHCDGPNHPSQMDLQGQIDMGVPWGIVPVIGDTAKATVACDILWWGDTLPDVPLERRQFIWGIFHCYQLYRDWWKQERGVVLPTWAYPADFIEKGVSPFLDRCEECGHRNLGKIDISDLQIGDMLIGRLYGSHPNHCGVYVGEDMLLHHPAGGASGKVELLRWWPRIEAVLRYEPANTSSVRRSGKAVRKKTPGGRKQPARSRANRGVQPPRVSPEGGAG